MHDMAVTEESQTAMFFTKQFLGPKKPSFFVKYNIPIIDNVRPWETQQQIDKIILFW